MLTHYRLERNLRIIMRFFHGLAAAAASVVINALMRDIYPKEEFSRMMSFVMLVTTIAPLVAPMAGGAVLVWFSWHAIFWILAVAALLASAMIAFFISETLPPEPAANGMKKPEYGHSVPRSFTTMRAVPPSLLLPI